MRTVSRVVCVMGVLIGISGSAGAQEPPLIALTSMPPDHGFIGKKDQPAKDVSGMACMPQAGGKRICLIINDQNRNAQFASIENGQLRVGQPIKLFGKEPPVKTVGREPAVRCENDSDFADLDGEGVAYAEPYFYVVGSHGCSRKKNELHLSSFLLARVRVDREGRPVDRHGEPVTVDQPKKAIETTWRVSDLLRRADRAGDFFGKPLKDQDGLNIEGIAVSGDTVWFGLRAPVDKGDAFLIRGSATDLFGDDGDPATAFYDTVPIKLDGRGIRDLAMLPDGRLLVLAGPPQEEDLSFRLYVADTDTRTARPVGTLPEIERVIGGEKVRGKAEVVTVLGTTPDGVSIVVMFDSLLNGEPHRAYITIPMK